MQISEWIYLPDGTKNDNGCYVNGTMKWGTAYPSSGDYADYNGIISGMTSGYANHVPFWLYNSATNECWINGAYVASDGNVTNAVRLDVDAFIISTHLNYTYGYGGSYERDGAFMWIGGNINDPGITLNKMTTPFPVFAVDDVEGYKNYVKTGNDTSALVKKPFSVYWNFVVDDATKMCHVTADKSSYGIVTSYNNNLYKAIDTQTDNFELLTSNNGDLDSFISLVNTSNQDLYLKLVTSIQGQDVSLNFEIYLRFSFNGNFVGLCLEPSPISPIITNDYIYPNKVDYIIGDIDENLNPDDGKDIDDEDTVDFPKDDIDDLPFASHTILTQTYVLPKPQIDALGVALWDTNFFEALIKNANYPLDNIVSCKLFPLNIGHGDANQLKIGNVDMGFQANKLSNKQVYKSNVLHYSPIFTKRKFLNYEPYSNYMLYLPFVGTVNIGSQFLVDRDIQICWIVDFVTGDLTTVVLSDGRTRYTFNSQVAVDIPLSASNRSQVEASTLKQAVGNLIGGNVGGVVSSAVSGLLSGETSTSTPPSSSNALCMSMTPYIIAERVQYVDSDGYDKTYGVPLREYWQLGYLQGFTQCQNVHLEKCSATSEEKAMIETLLEKGVYL